MSMAKNARRRRGVVLVIALLLIALSCLILVGTARQSLLAVSASLDAEQELQRRWGAFSCKQTLFPIAEEYFDRIESTSADLEQRPYVAALLIELGDIEFDLLLADEDAKLKLNSAWRHAGIAGVRESIRALSSERLPTLAIRARQPESGNVLDSWGQIFVLDELTHPTSTAASLRNFAKNASCWGDGRINVRRAPDDIVSATCGWGLSEQQTRKLLALRRQMHWLELSELMQRMALREAEVEAFSNLLKNDSSHYSLWITMRSTERTEYEFIVTGNTMSERNDEAVRASVGGIANDVPVISFRW